MLIRTLKIVLACGSPCLAGAISTGSVPHEQRSELALQHWQQGPRLSSDTIIPVRIGLTQRNLETGHDLLLKISDPESPSYGKYLGPSDIAELFAPKEESINAVTAWLTSSGIEYERLRLSANRQWIKFDAAAAEVERLLHAEYHFYQHQSTHEAAVASEAYVVPDFVKRHVDYVLPGILLRSTQKSRKSLAPQQAESRMWKRSNDRGLANCTVTGLTPECIADKRYFNSSYGITQANTAVQGNEIGFYESDNDIYHQPDMDLFTAHYYPRIPQGFGPTLLSIDNASLVYKDGTFEGDYETSIDTQVAMPIVYPQGFTIWQVASTRPLSNPVIEFNTWLDAIDGSYCNYTAFNITGDSPGIDPTYPNKRWPRQEQCGVYKPTNVISISWGDAEAAYPTNYMKRQCNEYMKLGLQGVSVLFCSQDSGVAGGDGVPDQQAHNDCLGKHGTVFAPIWPATCPYITSVGATTFPHGSDILDHKHEKAAQFSGGGFSNVWSAPEYQHSAVKEYLTNHQPSHPSYSTKNNKHIGKGGGVFNRNGRGFPDLAALGKHYLGYTSGRRHKFGGTSMATPIWAAVITRINEERLLANKSTLGFLNPALYKHQDLMYDILTGSNEGCPYFDIGFNVTRGWDPVTGLGSPNFPRLMEYFKSL